MFTMHLRYTMIYESLGKLPTCSNLKPYECRTVLWPMCQSKTVSEHLNLRKAPEEMAAIAGGGGGGGAAGGAGGAGDPAKEVGHYNDCILKIFSSESKCPF